MDVRIIEGFENYSVDGEGTVRNVKTGRVMKLTVNCGGYLAAQLSKDGKNIHRLVHRLVADTFISNPENKRDVDHINNTRSDNRIENLRWATRKENVQHAARQGRMNYSGGKFKGSGHPSSKLTDTDVITIKQLLSEGVTQIKIGMMFGVNKTTISYIKLGKTWSHLKPLQRALPK